jgi:hypothetical protein
MLPRSTRESRRHCRRRVAPTTASKAFQSGATPTLDIGDLAEMIPHSPHIFAPTAGSGDTPYDTGQKDGR